MRRKYLEAIEQDGWVHSEIEGNQHVFEKHYDNLNAEVQFTVDDCDFYDAIMDLSFEDIVWSCKDNLNPVAVEQQINLDLTIMKGRLKEAHNNGQMKLSEFITFLQEHANGGDPMVDFITERWSNDLTCCDYYPALFESAPVEHGKMTLVFSMDGEE